LSVSLCISVCIHLCLSLCPSPWLPINYSNPRHHPFVLLHHWNGTLSPGFFPHPLCLPSPHYFLSHCLYLWWSVHGSPDHPIISQKDFVALWRLELSRDFRLSINMFSNSATYSQIWSVQQLRKPLWYTNVPILRLSRIIIKLVGERQFNFSYRVFKWSVSIRLYMKIYQC